MKKFFQYLLITIMSTQTVLFAKEYTSALNSLELTTKEYRELQLNTDMEKSLDYIYPPVFKVTPKEMLLAGFEMAKKSGKLPKISKFSQTIQKPLKHYNKGLYTIVSYTMNMNIDLTPPVSKAETESYAQIQKMLKNPKEVEAFKSFTLKMLKMSLGEDAKIESAQGSMLVNVEKDGKYLAIKEDTNEWKFVDLAPMAIAQIKPVLPADIIRQEKEIFNIKTLSPQEQMKAMMEMIQNVQNQ